MKPNFAIRTLILLAAWLVFENFNLATHRCTARSVACIAHHTRSENATQGAAKARLAVPCCVSGKSIESCTHPVHDAFSKAIHFSAPPLPYRIKTIVLDAGHGGKDPGCIGASAQEKENTLAIVLRLGAYIEANYPEIKVIYTRDTDVFVELNERAAIANRNNADLFISVHCNALSVKSAHGAETYVLGLHRSKDNLEVARRENASILLETNYQKNYDGYDPGSPEAEIFANLWQSAYLEQSILFASYVQQFASAVAFREDRGVKQAGFLVLRETAMPSVLVETGYLTHAAEDEYLASEEGREQMALAIFQAFEAYKRHMETGKPIEDVAAHAPPPAKKPVTKPVAKPAPQAHASSAPKSPANNPQSKISTQKSYTIFLLSWPNKLDPNVGQLALLTNVKELKKEGKYHYYSGAYSSRTDAEKVLPEIQNMGFKTATIVEN